MLLRNRPPHVGLLVGLLARRRLRGHHQPRTGRPSASATTSPRSTSAPCAGEQADLESFAPDLRWLVERLARHDRGDGQRARRRRRPTARRRRRDAHQRHHRDRRSACRSPTTRSRRCSSAPSTTSGTPTPTAAPLGGHDRQLAARAPRRAVPRPPVRQRRPLVLPARAVPRRRVGRRRPPPPARDREPRAHRAAHGARGRPRPRRPVEHPLGRVRHRAARRPTTPTPSTRSTASRCSSPTRPPSSAAASPAGT